MLKIDQKQEKSSLKIDNFISIISIFIDNNIQKRIQFQESKKTENGSDQNDLENEEMKGFQNGIMEPF